MAADANLSNQAKTVHVTVDNTVLEAPEGATLLQVMLDAGLDIPHYCYHPKLSIDGSCRLCQVRIEGVPKLQISCNTKVRDGMVVHASEPEVQLNRRGVLEMLLLNHPLDCPICDKAGECWLQNYSMRFGSRFSRALEPRRKHGKRLDIGERMLLDQERCILCRRCVRFCREISKTGELIVFNHGDHSVLDIYDRRLDNDYSMCTADVCPVGALETKDFHHKIRVWFLEEVGTICPGCSNGCNIMASTYKNRVWRLVPRRNDEVNETWMCDAGRLSYHMITDPERLVTPMIGGREGPVATDWNSAVGHAASELISFKERYGGSALGAVISPHLTNEENFRFGELLHTLGVKHSAMAVRVGKRDDFLIKAEKAANATGVRKLGLVDTADDGLEALLSACESGEVKGLYLCSGDLLDVVPAERLNAILPKLELLVVQDLKTSPHYAKAAVLLPSSTFAEKDGTFTNHAGRVQRLQKLIDPPPGWVTDGEIFTSILNQLESRQDRFDLEGIWVLMARDSGRFAGLRLDEIGPHGAELETPNT
jgi:NADH-quinone oxidoreductase subunit G